MELSGLVAVLNSTKDQVVEVRDLGPRPVAVKEGFALPIQENKPALGTNQQYEGFTYTIQAAKVIRNWTVVAKATNTEIDQANLNEALAAQGSVVRGLALVVLDIAKGVIPINPNYTTAQLVAAIQQRMR